MNQETEIVPAWGRALRAEVDELRTEVRALKARIGGAAFVGAALAQAAAMLLERLGA